MRPTRASASDARGAIDAVWRIESARLIAGLARIVRDVGVAEELAQDALVAALEQWPQSGVPENPGAWLMGTAKHRAIDLLRRRSVLERKHEALGRELTTSQQVAAAELEAAVDAAIDEDIGDDLLRLMFVACHPVLSTEARVALTLRLLGGLTTEEIARAFLVPRRDRGPADRARQAHARRGARALRGARRRGARARLASVLEVVYLVFNEGYSATAGEDWMRPALCEDALRLGRILAELLPREPEVHGLVALMEIQASRSRARTGPPGEPILLLDQDRARWDRVLIGRGLAALDRAERARAAAPSARPLRAAGRDRRLLTRGRAHPRRPTGCASRRSTTRSRSSRRRRSWSSTARSRSRWRSARGPASSSSTRWPPHARWRATTCCRASAATCSRSSAATTEAGAELRRAAELTRNGRERELLLAARRRVCTGEHRRLASEAAARGRGVGGPAPTDPVRAPARADDR